jgi:hypothetical protein
LVKILLFWPIVKKAICSKLFFALSLVTLRQIWVKKYVEGTNLPRVFNKSQKAPREIFSSFHFFYVRSLFLIDRNKKI